MIDPKVWEESGILLVDKPMGWTSHDVVNCIRQRFHISKVGHCGTLDPAATGLLVVVLGRATKLSNQLSGQDKAYSGTLRLGIETDSQDSEGKIIAECAVPALTDNQVQEAFAPFQGELEQIPPMVSAIKKDGKPLYKLARKGIEIEREPRPITIHDLTVTDIHLPDVDFDLTCSKGTYVRTLCADIGAKIGCGGYLLALRRTRSGRFHLSGASTMDTIKSWERDDLFQHMMSLADILSHMQ